MFVPESLLIVGTIGKRCSGKSTVSRLLPVISNCETGVVRISQIIERDFLVPFNLPFTRENYDKSVPFFGSWEEIVSRAYQTADQLSGYPVIHIDGIRSKYAVDLLRRRNGILMGVIASNRNRYIRRGEKKDDIALTFKEFLAKDQDPYERFVDDLMLFADDVIVNNSDIRDFRSKLTRWFDATRIN